MTSTTTASSSTIRTRAFSWDVTTSPFARMPPLHSYRQKNGQGLLLFSGGARVTPLRLDLLLHDLEEAGYLPGNVIEMRRQADPSQPRGANRVPCEEGLPERLGVGAGDLECHDPGSLLGVARGDHLIPGRKGRLDRLLGESANPFPDALHADREDQLERSAERGKPHGVQAPRLEAPRLRREMEIVMLEVEPVPDRMPAEDHGLHHLHHVPGNVKSPDPIGRKHPLVAVRREGVDSVSLDVHRDHAAALDGIDEKEDPLL